MLAKIIAHIIDNPLNADSEFILETTLSKLLYYDELNELIQQINWNKLSDLVFRISDENTRICVIEAIVAFYDPEDPGVKVDSRLLDEYIRLIDHTNNRESYRIAQCLNTFQLRGRYTCEEIVVKLIASVPESLAASILAQMSNRSNWPADDMSNINILTENHKELGSKVAKYEKIKYRSWVLSMFLMITNPLYREYSWISGGHIRYANIDDVVNDWTWRQDGSIKYMVDRGIVSEEEEKILLELGGLLAQKIEIDNPKLNILYDKLFKDRDVIKVIYTLP